MRGFYPSPERATLSREAQLRAQLEASDLAVMELREQNSMLAEQIKLLKAELRYLRKEVDSLNMQRSVTAHQIRRLGQRMTDLEARMPVTSLPSTPPRRPYTTGGERVQVTLPARPPASPMRSIPEGIATSRSRTPVFSFSRTRNGKGGLLNSAPG